MNTLLQTRVQESFPLVDLHEYHAEYLGIEFANPETLELEHLLSEQRYPTFQASHPVLNAAARKFYDETDHLPQIDRGIMIYEGLHSYLSSRAHTSSPRLNHNMIKINKWLHEGEYDEAVRDYLASALSEFILDMSRTTSVIREASRKEFRHSEEFVVLGAAWARKIQRVGIDLAKGRIGK
jgi:hypothetical protein